MKMSDANSQDLAKAMTVLSANKIIHGQNNYLSAYQSSIVNNLSILIEIRSGTNSFVNGFTLNEMNQMIEIIATD